MKFLILIFAMLGLSCEAAIFDTNRIVDWTGSGSNTNSANWPIYTNAITAGAYADGVHDDSLVLQAIFAAATNGSVVYLPTGTYLVSTNFVITKSVVVRGNGPQSTHITASALVRNPVFTFQTPNSRFSGSQIFAQVTNGMNKYSTNFMLKTTTLAAGLSPSNNVLFDQINDGIFADSLGNQGNCAYCSVSNGIRAINQIAKVMTTNGQSFTTDSPLYWNYGTNNPNLPSIAVFTNDPLPEISWWTGNTLKNCGLESLSIDDTAATNAQGAFNCITYFFYCDNSWVSNVWTTDGTLAHVLLYSCYHFSVQGCYFNLSKNYASSSYGVELSQSCTACLVENNIFNSITASVVLGWGSTANVISYNFMTNAPFSNTNWNPESISIHDAHGMFNLIEGNDTPQIAMDFIHGSGSHQMIFRNRSWGWQTNRSQVCVAVYNYSHSTFCNIAGNVLSTPTNWTRLNGAIYIMATNAFNISQQATYAFGYDAIQSSSNNFDQNPQATAFLHGNYDFVSSNLVWNAGTADHALPASLYLAGQPGWWPATGSPWPPIDPATPTLISAVPAKVRFDAIQASLNPTSYLPFGNFP